MADDLRTAVRALIAEHDPDEYESEGDAWIYHDSELMVDSLTDAIVRLVEARRD